MKMEYNRGIMPELPEVETVRRGLRGFILNKKIIRVAPEPGKGFQGDVKNVNGATVVDLRRKGKALLIDLDNGYTMMIHLRMTGQLIWRGRGLLSSRIAASDFPVRSRRMSNTAPLRPSNLPCTASKLTSPQGDQKISSQLTSPQGDQSISSAITSPQGRVSFENEPQVNKHEKSGAREGGQEETSAVDASREQFAAGHPSKNFTAELPNTQTRVTFEFAEGKLFFNDQRKFGFVKVLPTGEVEQDKFIRELGKEPWEMTAAELYEKCQRHGRSPIKAVLLNQKLIAGLGNIYADESLFYAGVHPATKAGELTEERVEKLLEGACKTMEASIASGGSTMATYVRPDGTTGSYLENFAQVFRREGQKCRKCGEEIVKTRCAGRGTHYCPHCQKNARRGH